MTPIWLIVEAVLALMALLGYIMYQLTPRNYLMGFDPGSMHMERRRVKGTGYYTWRQRGRPSVRFLLDDSFAYHWKRGKYFIGDIGTGQLVKKDPDLLARIKSGAIDVEDVEVDRDPERPHRAPIWVWPTPSDTKPTWLRVDGARLEGAQRDGRVRQIYDETEGNNGMNIIVLLLLGFLTLMSLLQAGGVF